MTAQGPVTGLSLDLFDDALHHLALASEAVDALRANSLQQAFALIDRRCRIEPPPEPEHHLLRAAILRKLGQSEAALDAVRAALAIAPELVIANRWLLDAGTPEEGHKAAKTLIRHDTHAASLLKALATFHDQGIRGVGLVKGTRKGLSGWAAWSDNAPLEIALLFEEGSRTFLLPVQEGHALEAAFGQAANFHIPWPEETVAVRVIAKGITFIDPVAHRPELSHAPHKPSPHKSTAPATISTSRQSHVSIIIPVYDDAAATIACFESLLADTPSIPRRIIAIDDNTPEPRIRDYLDDLVHQNRIELIRNLVNLGFVGSVNRALRQASGDILLLNADTLVPPGFLDRLHQAAYAHEAIGTLTPLSNNGEFTSFPKPFRENSLPSYEDILILDRRASETNHGMVVDIPNGIGFCLYITRSCLEAVGELGTQIERGYFEDVDFCLRAAQKGFRNVCAADVFVGHAGSRSFKDDKRALVMRNMPAIEKIYPTYRADCAAFMKRDPLRPIRETVELRHAPTHAARLVVTGPFTSQSPLTRRLAQLKELGEAILVLELLTLGGAIQARLFSADDTTAPQNVARLCKTREEREILLQDIARFSLARIELADPASIPLDIAADLLRLDLPFDVFVGDAGLVCPRRSMIDASGAFCGAPLDTSICNACVAKAGAVTAVPPGGVAVWRRMWLTVADAASQIVWSHDEAQNLLAQFDDKLKAKGSVLPCNPALLTAPGKGNIPPRLAIIGASQDAQTFAFLQNLVQALRPVCPLTIIGATFDDVRLMASGCHVTGPVSLAEIHSQLDLQGITHVLLANRQACFDPALEDTASSAQRPVARFTFHGQTQAAAEVNHGLTVPASLPAYTVALALTTWMVDNKAS